MSPPEPVRPATQGPIYEEARQAEKAKRLFDAADDVPALIERLGGGLGERVRERLVERIASDPLARESVRRQAEIMRRDLEGENPTAIERLLVERVVVGWLALAWADLLCDAFGYDPDGGEVGGYCLRMRSAANRDYLASLKALALIRRAAPAVTVNVKATVKVKRKGRGGGAGRARRPDLLGVGRD